MTTIALASRNNKAAFDLTDDEAVKLEELTREIESRIASEIGAAFEPEQIATEAAQSA